MVLPRESLNDLDPEYANPERQAGGELRAPAVPAARRRDPSRRGHAGGGGHRRPGKLSLQLRTDHDRRRAGSGGSRGGVRSIHRADEAAAGELRGAARNGLRGFLGASARGERQALHESALSAAAARPGESARTLPGGDRGAPGARNSRGAAGLSAGERGAGRTQKQSGGSPRPACRRWPSTVRSTTRNCRSCSWISSAA